ncbi:MAG: SPASM domain-containing protein, partial [Deltaproteobacteria bacterium]|nr:SPASM domain-containing protein [Deltaproteobacteria bacterium]
AKELSRLGTERVIFAGTGEPLLHPYLLEILSLFRRSGLGTRLFTNGILLDKEMSSGILNVGLDRLIVSLWGSTPESYAECHPGADPDQFIKIVGHVREFIRQKRALGVKTPEIFLNHVCNVFTYREISDKIELAHEMGCDGLYFTPFDSWGENARFAGLTADQTDFVLKSLRRAVKQMASLHLKHNIDWIFLRHQFDSKTWQKIPCYIGRYQTRVRVDGAVMPCCFCDEILGDMNKTTLQKIWNDAPYQDFRARTENLKGLASLKKSCTCEWCCYIPQNYRVHRIFKWFTPLKQH